MLAALAITGLIAAAATFATWLDRLPRKPVQRCRNEGRYGDAPALPRGVINRVHAEDIEL